MNAKTLFLINSQSRDVALIGPLFESAGLKVDYYWAYNDEFPTSLDSYDGVFLSGSPHSAYDDEKFIHKEHELVQVATHCDLPILGVCYGSQLLASALCGLDQVFRRNSCNVGYQHLHGEYSNRSLKAGDILQVECTPSVRNYHARFMRTIKIGCANDQERRNAELLIDIQNRALDAVGPDFPASNADRIYRDGILASGLTNSYTNKTFYSIGLILRPSGGEPLEAVPGCKWHFEPNMTFHTYLLVGGFGFSETIVVTETAYERLTNYSRCLLVT
jgi:GMP synthase-like glutamine amidotransferase